MAQDFESTEFKQVLLDTKRSMTLLVKESERAVVEKDFDQKPGQESH